jgi:hypothetical protein
MSGDQTEKAKSPLESHAKVDNQANQGFFADAYELGANAVDWAEENPGTAAALGLVAAAGIGYLTRGKWMPLVSRLAPVSDDAARVVAARPAAFDAAKAGLTLFDEAAVANPALNGWKTALSYGDVGIDKAGALIYRGTRAGQFGADNVLLVQGADEANTLFRAISREGLLERKIWERGAGSAAADLAEVQLPGATKFVFGERAVTLPANGRLVNLGNGEFNTLTAEAAEKMYRSLTML